MVYETFVLESAVKIVHIFRIYRQKGVYRNLCSGKKTMGLKFCIHVIFCTRDRRSSVWKWKLCVMSLLGLPESDIILACNRIGCIMSKPFFTVEISVAKLLVLIIMLTLWIKINGFFVEVVCSLRVWPKTISICSEVIRSLGNSSC